MLNILLAEDNPGDVFLVRRALDEHNISYALHIVKDGEEAINFMEAIGPTGFPCPDLLLLDINLPKFDGPQVLAVFRRCRDCARVPVIMVSSSDASADREIVAALGVYAYFRKPPDLAEFMTLGGIVRDVIESKAA